jgi:hypothetical protein
MQIEELEKEIITLRVQNRYAALQLQNIHDEIENFTNQYYSAIEDICLKLAEIEAGIKQYDTKIATAKKIEIYPQTTSSDIGYNYIQPREEKEIHLKTSHSLSKFAVELELKDLYRSLIKIVHPDVSEEKLRSAEYAMMVNKAYNERNYRQLVELDQLIRRGNASLAELKLQRNKLVDATFELKMQREDLLDNPIYILAQEFAEADDGGISMLQDVRAKLDEKVSERKRDLRNLKLEYLETVAGLITS